MSVTVPHILVVLCVYSVCDLAVSTVSSSCHYRELAYVYCDIIVFILVCSWIICPENKTVM